jgi:hypothetical protein
MPRGQPRLSDVVPAMLTGEFVIRRVKGKRGRIYEMGVDMGADKTKGKDEEKPAKAPVKVEARLTVNGPDASEDLKKEDPPKEEAEKIIEENGR